MNIEEMRVAVADHDLATANGMADVLFTGVRDAVRQHLKDTTLSQERLAMKAGITPTRVSKLLAKNGTIGFGALAKIMVAIGCNARIIVAPKDS